MITQTTNGAGDIIFTMRLPGYIIKPPPDGVLVMQAVDELARLRRVGAKPHTIWRKLKYLRSLVR